MILYYLVPTGTSPKLDIFEIQYNTILIFQLFGFLSQAMIKKDWLAFGHKFNDRYGHIQTNPKEISPIFTQLLECTWQLMQQRNMTHLNSTKDFC
jgi:hypothetical protein